MKLNIETQGNVTITTNIEEEKDHVDYIEGGFADDFSNEQIIKLLNSAGFDGKAELEKGRSVEREHTSDDKIAYEIARDHLLEFPDYYIYLEKMEDELKKKWKKRKILINKDFA